jgi:hypothetical protein
MPSAIDAENAARAWQPPAATGDDTSLRPIGEAEDAVVPPDPGVVPGTVAHADSNPAASASVAPARTPEITSRHPPSPTRRYGPADALQSGADPMLLGWRG